MKLIGLVIGCLLLGLLIVLYIHYVQCNVFSGLIHEGELQERTSIKQLRDSHTSTHIVNNMIDEYRATKNPAILVSIGDLYRKGIYQVMHSDSSIAAKCYEKASFSRDKDISTIARDKYADAVSDKLNIIDDIGEYELHNDALDAILEEEIITEPTPEEQVIQHEHPVFLNDMQNVHDHYVVKTINKNLATLQRLNPPITPINDIITKVHDASIFNDEQKADIINVIESLTIVKSQFDVAETTCLSMVYGYISMHKDADNLIESLFIQLFECKEHRIVVCSTGKIARIVSVLSTLDGFDDMRNIYYIKTELEQLASKVRDDALADLSDDIIKKYNEASPSVAHIVKSMQDEYMKRVKQIYCDDMGIKYDIIEPHVDANMIVF